MRLALGLEYCGRTFTGWQTQPDGRGVQDALERALAVIADAKIATVAAGRTDAGVHASMQVVHFDADARRPDTAWVRGVNANLPDTVGVLWALPVASEFHARFDALQRHYTYVLSVRTRRLVPSRPRCRGDAGGRGRTRRHPRLFRVPRRGVPGEVSDAHAVRPLDRLDG
jgi:tRNA pseudouridine38-40 synthase